MIHYFLVNYFLFIVLIVFFYIVGTLVLLKCNTAFTNWFFETSLKIFFGTIISTTLYAIIKTDFITFLNGMFIFLFVVIYQLTNKKSTLPQPRTNYNLPKIILLTISSFISFALFYFVSFDFSDQHLGDIIAPRGDLAEYARISYYINKTGYENTFGIYNLLDGCYNGFHMYHYYELWLNGMIAEVFQLNHSVALLTITNPLLYFNILICFYMIIEEISQRTKFKPFYFLLGGLALMYCSAPAGIEKIFSNINLYSNYSAGSYVIKYGYYSIIILFAAFFYLRKNNVLAYTMLTGIIFFTTSPLPLLLILTTFIFLTNNFFNFFTKEEIKKVYLLLILLFGSNILLLCILPQASISVDGVDMTSILQLIEINNLGYFRRIINIIIGQSFFYFVLFSPYLILFFLIQYFPERKLFESLHIFTSKEFIFLLSVFYSGLIAWGILHKNVEGVQLFYNYFIYFADAFLVICIVNTFYAKPSIPKTILLILFISTSLLNFREFLSLPNTPEHSKNYLSEIKKEIQQNKSQYVGYIQSHNFGDPFFSPYFYTLGTELLTVQDGFYSIGLNDLEGKQNNIYKKIDIERYHKALKNSLLKNFQKSNASLSLTELKLQFLKKYNITMVIVPQNEFIDPSIQALSKKIISDPKSGERFITLDLSKIQK